MHRFDQRLAAEKYSLRRARIEVLQVNVGRKCNQACRHCHVDAGPWRTEMMSAEIVERVTVWIRTHRPATVDITGGAPELNPNFRRLAVCAREAGARVIDRNNLTILSETGHEDLANFLAANQIEIVASLPCYLPENVTKQRGAGVYERSIRGLQTLNGLGYGTTKELPLHLVYNPVGPTLPAPQAELEADYREALRRDHGVEFTSLYTITNQPIARFAEDLRARGEWDAYLELLATSFNPATLDGLMCRNTISVDFMGAVYDCDFNQMLGLGRRNGRALQLWDITPTSLEGAAIITGVHCFACTAGCGSSCGGALAN